MRIQFGRKILFLPNCFRKAMSCQIRVWMEKWKGAERVPGAADTMSVAPARFRGVFHVGKHYWVGFTEPAKG